MAGKIDNRIVQMQFNNSNFEKNIATSSKTLGRFGDVLNNLGKNSNLSSIEKQANSINLNGIISAIDKVNSKFSIMGAIAFSTLNTITSQAVLAGQQFISSLTTEPIITGFNEFETKMNSIKTILSNTSASGTTLDDVNAALSEMNDYADTTIYNFAQMTDMVGKFAATSGDLGSSVNIVKGMANLAAEAGAGNTQLQSALYQTSQALSGSYLQLMDWNSLENAGLATQSFRTDLLAMAESMGTIDATTLDNIRNEVISFGHTLEDGWLTSDVFAAVLEGYANDEAMTAMAGEITTFTKLIGVMQESVQSGWAVTWELIVGSYEEGVALLTNIGNWFSDYSGEQADARNNMLEGWRDLGGREVLIEGLGRAFQSLLNIIEPIKEAFREIFPPTTSQQLYDITVAFNELTKQFEITDQTGEQIKEVFVGIFGAVKTVLTVLGDISETFVKIISGAKPLIDVILELFVLFVDLGKTILDFVKPLDILQVIFTGFILIMDIIVTSVASVLTILKDLISYLDDLINIPDFGAIFSMTDVDTSGAITLTTVFDDLKESFSNFYDYIYQISEPLRNIFQGILNFFSPLINVFSSVFNAIVRIIDQLDLYSIIALANTAIAGILAIDLHSITKSFSTMFDNMSEFSTNFTGILEGLKDVLKSYQDSLKADALLKIAAAVGLLTISLIALTLLDPDKASNAILLLSVLLGELIGSLSIMTKATAGIDTAKLAGISVVLIAMSVAIMLLAGTLILLGLINPEILGTGLIAISSILAVLTTTIFALGKMENDVIKAAASMTIMAIAINLLAGSVILLGLMGGEVFIGIAALAAILTALSVALIGLEKANVKPSTVANMIIMAVAINMLTMALIPLTLIPVDGLAKSLSALIVLLGFTALLLDKLPKNTAGSAAGLLVMGFAMESMVRALIALSFISMEDLAKGLTAIIAGIGFMALVLNQLPAKSTATATALSILSASLIMFAIAMKILSSIPLEGIGIGLLAILGVFTIFGVAALVLSPLTPVMLAIGAAFLMLGAAAMLAGIGLNLVAIAIASLVISGAAGIGLFILLAEGLIQIIPTFAKALAEGFLTFVETIANNGPAIGAAIGAIFIIIVTAITEAIPGIIMALGELLKALLIWLNEDGLVIVVGLIAFITQLLLILLESVGEFIIAGYEIILALMHGLSEKMPELIQTAIDTILNFVNALANAVRDNGYEIGVAARNLMTAFKDALKLAVAGMFGIGEDSVRGFLDGINSMWDRAWNTVWNFFTGIVDGVKEVFGIHSPSRVFKDIAHQNGYGFINGFVDMMNPMRKTVTDFGNTAVDGVAVAMSNLASVTDEDLSMSPTITPVVDMTNVTQSAKDLNTLMSDTYVNKTASIAVKTPKRAATAEEIEALNAKNTSTTIDKDGETSNPTPVNVNVTLEGSTKKIFKVVKEENDSEIKRTGNNPLAKTK